MTSYVRPARSLSTVTVHVSRHDEVPEYIGSLLVSPLHFIQGLV